MRLAMRLVPLIASYASLYGLYFTVMPPGTPRSGSHTALLLFSIVACLFITIADIHEYLRSKPRSYSNSADIERYMIRWISSGGRVAVFSRDMSWAENNKEVQALLLKKSERRELILLAEAETPLTRELQSVGAQLIYYGKLGFVPMSRFTIIDYGKLDARVAIGARSGGLHNIKEHDATSSVEYYLANDLVKLLIDWKGYDVSADPEASQKRSTAPLG